MIGVLGASGFIGRSLADYLAQQQHSYKLFLRQARMNNVPAFSGDPQIAAFDMGTGVDASVFEGIETLVLSTSATRPNMPENNIENEILSNVLPHSQLFSQLLNSDVKHIIFLSSGGTIYGNIDQVEPITEDMPRHPCSPYGYGKLCIESALENIWVGAGRRFTIIRAANPVGPHQLASIGAHGLVTTTFHNIQNDKEIKIFGDGTAVRDYFSVYDLSRLIAIAATKDLRESVIVNASSGQGLNVNDVVALCAAELGKRPRIKHDLGRQPKIQSNILSNEKALEIFGWKPTMSFSQIVSNLNAFLDADQNQRG